MQLANAFNRVEQGGVVGEFGQSRGQRHGNHRNADVGPQLGKLHSGHFRLNVVQRRAKLGRACRWAAVDLYRVSRGWASFAVG